MYLIALTGGIASGKSSVSSRLHQLGAVCIDADQVAREVVEPGMPALSALKDRFGADIIAVDGSLNRGALAALAFSDDAARAALNAITHPAIQARVHRLVADACALDPHAFIVYDVPLYVEAVAQTTTLPIDSVVVVHAPEDERRRRLISDRGMTAEDADRRIRSQASDAERLAIADHVLDNSGTPAQLIEQVDSLWAQLSPLARQPRNDEQHGRHRQQGHRAAPRQ